MIDGIRASTWDVIRHMQSTLVKVYLWASDGLFNLCILDPDTALISDISILSQENI